MFQLATLKSATSLRDIAAIVNFKASALAYILYKKPLAEKYNTFEINKRGGGTRRINAPSDDLRLVQRRIGDILQDCIQEINNQRNRKDQIAHGFKRHRSIITNASKHSKKRYVFNIDLENFFGTINFGRVRGFFISDNNFALKPAVATVLAQIACHENSLPQGSPCSPVISNLVGHLLDVHLVKLASSEGCTYSRYADDLTFSTNERIFPSVIAKQKIDGPHEWQAGDDLQEIVTHAGFTINANKTRMQYRNSRQDVTGLVVNRKVNIRSDYRRTVRAMAHHLFTSGRFERVDTVRQVNGVSMVIKKEGTLNQLHGMFGHIDRVDWHNAEASDKGQPERNSVGVGAKENLYRRFLLFKEFHVAPAPLIVCEGKTDNVYLRQTIRSLAANYPLLATVAAGGSVTLNVRIFQYPNTSTGRILSLKGGTGDLKNLIELYRRESVRFTAPGRMHPIILLVDNDDGAKSIVSLVQQIAKIKSAKTEAFVRILQNCYLVLTPLQGTDQSSVIEDSFTQQARSTVINNKTFDPSNNYETSTHYGKSEFSRYVEENASAIDFGGFNELLTRLSAVITAHKQT